MVGLIVFWLGIILFSVGWIIGIYAEKIIIGLISVILGIGMIVVGTNKQNAAILNAKTEYEIVNIVHYQAVNAEEINQVLLEDKDGKLFFIYVNDKKFLEMRKQKENGDMVVSLSKNDFTKIANTK